MARLSGREFAGAADRCLSREEMGALRKAAFTWYRKNLQGSTVTNAETGMEIRFSRTGASETVSGKGHEALRTMPASRQIIENGRHILRDEPHEDEAAIVCWYHTFEAAVDLEGRPFTAYAILREQTDGIYHYELGVGRGGARKQAPARDPCNILSSHSGVNEDTDATARYAPVSTARGDRGADILNTEVIPRDDNGTDGPGLFVEREAE